MTTFPPIGVWTLPLVLALCSSCSGTSSDDSAPDDSGSGAEGPDVNECAPSKYVDLSADSAERVIAVSTITTLAYTPACAVIKAGQTVRFEGSLASHPLAPANDIASSPANPIKATSTGSSVEFTFPEAGSFAYYCGVHGTPNGTGMAGVIYVTE